MLHMMSLVHTVPLFLKSYFLNMELLLSTSGLVDKSRINKALIFLQRSVNSPVGDDLIRYFLILFEVPCKEVNSITRV